MTLPEQLRYLDDIMTLWTVGEIDADECWGYVQAIIEQIEAE